MNCTFALYSLPGTGQETLSKIARRYGFFPSGTKKKIIDVSRLYF